MPLSPSEKPNPSQGKLDFNKPTKPVASDKTRLEPSEGIDWDEFVRRTGGKRKWENGGNLPETKST